MPERPLRVVHLPAAVGGHPPMLAEAERRIGLDSRSIVVDPPAAGYEVDEILSPPGTGTLRREWRRWRLLARLLREADVVHYNFGRPLAPLAYPRSIVGPRPGGFAWQVYASASEFLDVRLLRRRGVAVFVTYQGDDVRTGATAPPELAELYDPALDRRKTRWAARFAGLADGVYALNPDLLPLLPGAEFLPYASVDLERWRPPPQHEDGGRPLVVHAPSDRAVKGTDALLTAVERLRRAGVDFDFELVEGKTREAARASYERASVFVDQLVLGWYGGAAVESMALGKVVVARLDAAQLARVPPALAEQLPVVDASADTIERVLRTLLTGPADVRAQLGARGRAFVETWHRPETVAARVAADYERAVGARRVHGRRPTPR